MPEFRRKRIAVGSLRRGMHVLTIDGDGEMLSEDELRKCIPQEVVQVKRGEDFTGVKLRNPWVDVVQETGLGNFDNAAKAYIATAEDMDRERERREALAREETEQGDSSDGETSGDEPLGDVASSSESVMADPPADWPRFPEGVLL